MLPRLDGFALCRRLREDPAYLHLPVILHSFRVEGPKYEAFAAEVGALALPAARLDARRTRRACSTKPRQRTATMRMPALVPELLDRREQDRRRLVDLEQQLREAEATNLQLTAAERVARERAEYESRARAEFAAAESVRIREMQLRIRDLETAQRQAAEAESRRAARPRSRARKPPSWPCSKRASMNCRPRAHARSPSRNDAERAFADAAHADVARRRRIAARACGDAIRRPRWSGRNPPHCAAGPWPRCCRASNSPTMQRARRTCTGSDRTAAMPRLELQRVPRTFRGTLVLDADGT